MTPSERTRKELVAMKVPSPILWGRGVDAAWFNPNRRSRLRRETRGGDHRVHVLHVGRLATEKDVDTLIAAFQRAHAVLTDSAVFCVAGDGPRAREVRDALPFAMHYGFLQRDDLADLYADADLFVFPSATETCGLVVLEALASRLPVIAANAGGVPENVMDGRTGLLITPRNADGFSQAIIALTIDSAERNAMAEAARVFAQGRGWGREMDALESIYASIAQSTSEVATPSIWPATTSVG